MKRIYIFLDMDIIEVIPGKYIFPIAHDSVIREMAAGMDVIYTHDPYFFQFDTLSDGYDVIAMRDDKGVVLSELLTPLARKKYKIDKEIRWAHNAYKILMSGALEMQPMMFEVPPLDHESINILKRPIRGI